MKNILLSLIIILVFSCETKRKQESQNVSQANPKKIIGKKFFEYDEIDHYFNNYDEDKLSELYDNQSKTEIDSFKMGVILDRIPKDSLDLKFVDKLNEIGYVKTKIPKSKFKGIDSIFIEKSVENPTATGCIYVYRDILIFKKNDVVVGTAKICFGCGASQITGTSAITDNFGQKGDYSILESLLKRK
ncbi:hypothetical protein [Flavobacterium salmonis]|nr:hypothetical protein [Flavobacterium salmonis]